MHNCGHGTTAPLRTMTYLGPGTLSLVSVGPQNGVLVHYFHWSLTWLHDWQPSCTIMSKVFVYIVYGRMELRTLAAAITYSVNVSVQTGLRTVFSRDLMFLFCSTGGFVCMIAWCVRLSRLSVGF